MRVTRSAAPLAGMWLATLVGCAGLTENNAPPPLLTALPRALSAPEAGLIAAGNQFGFELFREARRSRPDDNLFLSPISASLALGMALNGAAGTTLDSMRLTLQLGAASLAEINAGYRGLIDLLRGLDASSTFEIANSIWGATAMPFRADFLAAVKSNFAAEVQARDFAAPATLAAINQWASDKTHGKIPTILDNIDPNEVAFLINAIYFKGSWRRAFTSKDTHPAPFHAAGGTEQTVATMERPEAVLGYANGQDAELIELPYGNGAFAMTIVLPHQGRTLTEVVAGLDGARWNQWIASLHDEELELSMPKFKLAYQRLLNDDLSTLGMRVAFDQTGLANFSAMANLAPGMLFISRVIQKTFVDVNEEGTEAAAVTAVGIGVTSAGPGPIHIDRPFLFVIRERLSGTIFFVGQVSRL